jgi:microcystin-dependent protein
MVARRLLTPIELAPQPQTGPPVSGAWRRGTLVCDAMGRLWLCSATGSPGIWGEVGGAAPAVAGYETGDLKPWPAASIPAGWLDCDGTAISRTVYAALFTVIGTAWGGGDGSATFNLPDLRRRTLVGAGGTGTSTLGNAVGSVGGAETHTLTTAQIPAHTHTAITAGSFTGNGFGGGNTQGRNGNTGSTGGGGAHNNLQPSAVVRWLIKAGP